MDWHLPQSSVYALVEDHEGFLWFGTREGLGRWDGYTMHTWKADSFDPASLPNNVIRSLVEDASGNLWISTEEGLARLGPKRVHIKRYGYAGSVVFLGQSGVPWLADFNGLHRYDADDDRFVLTIPKVGDTDDPSAALMDKQGMIWAIWSGNLLTRCDPKSQHCEPIPSSTVHPCDDRIQVLLEDDEGTLWAGTERGVCCLNESRTSLERWSPEATALHRYRVSMQQHDRQGKIWVATWGGVFRIDPDTGQADRYTLDLPGNIETQNIVWSLCIDRAGSVWVGTNWGVYRYDPHAKPFRHLGHDPDDSNSLSSGLISALFEDANDRLWVGSIGGGLNRVDRPTGRVTHFRHQPGDGQSLSSDIVWAITEDVQGWLWVGTNNGLNRLDPITGRFDVFKIDATWDARPGSGATGPNTITALHVDGNGRLWVGTYSHELLRWDPSRQRLVSVLHPSAGRIRAMASGADDVLWLGTENDGLIRLDTGSGTQTPYRHEAEVAYSISSNLIWSIHRDTTGILWLGTNNGLNRFDPKTGRATHYAEREGLPSAVVYGILEDDQGRLWLSTNRGLARFDDHLPPGRKIRSFDVNDGLHNVEFNRGAYFRSRTGTLLFGGDRGVSSFDPEAIHDNPYRPPVIITAAHTSTLEGTTTDRSLNAQPLALTHRDYTFSFEFVALNFTNPQRNQYASKLEGFENRWVELGTRRIATYTNVPPGRYIFRVRASNDDGLWKEDGASVALIVHPPFWQTWWFRMLAAAMMLGLVALAVWRISVHRYQQQLQTLEARQALEQERSRISRDMHDEVGANLTEIAIMSELARLGKALPEPVGERLDQIADTARDTLDSIGEIIWAINPENDRLDRLVGYLHNYAAQYFDEMSIHDTLRFPRDVPEVTVSAEFRRNVFLVQKEALHNLVRHAAASEALIELTLHDGLLDLRIQDNGRGFRAGDVQPESNGLRNMRFRAQEINGELSIESTPNQGTAVRLCVELPEIHPSM